MKTNNDILRGTDGRRAKQQIDPRTLGQNETPRLATIFRVAILTLLLMATLVAACGVGDDLLYVLPAAVCAFIFCLCARKWFSSDTHLAAYWARIDREHE